MPPWNRGFETLIIILQERPKKYAFLTMKQPKPVQGDVYLEVKLRTWVWEDSFMQEHQNPIQCCVLCDVFTLRQQKMGFIKKGVVCWSPSQRFRPTYDMLGLTKWWLVDTSAEPSCFQLCRGESMNVGLRRGSFEQKKASTPPGSAPNTSKIHR